MARFAVVIGWQEWLCDKKVLAEDTRTMIEAAGHTCEIWRLEDHHVDITAFLKSALKEDGPLALVYMGHGSDSGWCHEPGCVLAYSSLAEGITKWRQGKPTAIINDCCYAGAAATWLLKTSFDKGNTILLSAGISSRTSVAGETLEEHHTYHVLKSWFEDRRAFDPFLYNHNIRVLGDEIRDWPHWKREGPERFGLMDVDKYFFGVNR